MEVQQGVSQQISGLCSFSCFVYQNDSLTL